MSAGNGGFILGFPCFPSKLSINALKIKNQIMNICENKIVRNWKSVIVVKINANTQKAK